jgi:hypothetical protein
MKISDLCEKHFTHYIILYTTAREFGQKSSGGAAP